MGEVEEDGLAGSQMDKEKLDQIVSKLESKIVEKESVIESLEIDLKTVKTKFEATNEELKLIEEERDNLEQKFEQECGDKKKQDQESGQLKTLVESLTTEMSTLRDMETNFNQLDAQKTILEEKNRDLAQSIEDLEAKIGSLEQNASSTSEDANVMDEKYKEALRTIEDLERQQVQSNMDAESTEADLKEEKDQLKAHNLALENEISSLQEKIEASENNLSDLKESLSRVSERRNSLDATVTSLQSTIAQQKEELETCQAAIGCQEAQGLTIDHLTRENQHLTQQLGAMLNDLEKLALTKDNLRAEVESLKVGQVEAVRMEQELSGMREMIQALTGENETLLERISGLEEARPQQHPPPDITGHGHNPPDVASMASANNNPDIMFVSGAAGANPDIMDLGGQAQPAQGGWGWGEDAADEAANWFDQQVNIVITLVILNRLCVCLKL